MDLDPRTLGAAFVLLSAVLAGLLLFAWTLNRKVRALAWWGATFFLIPSGIGLAVLVQDPPGFPILLVSNALVAWGYGVLYAGCRAFNGRQGRVTASFVGPALWMFAFPIIHHIPGARLVLLSLITGGYAALSAWELWKHAPQRLVSQRLAVILLLALAAFNVFRGMTGLSLSSVFWMNTFVIRWSAEMGLLLVVYAPALAFIFLSMARESIESGRQQAQQALHESEEHYRYSVELNPQIPWIADPQGNILDVSSRWQALMGTPVDEALGSGWMQTLHPDDVAPTLQQWSHSVSTGERFETEYRLRQADGSYRWALARAAARRDADGSILRWYGMAEDIHDRKLAQEALHWAAYHDDLTGLPNRRLFQERLQQVLDQAARAQQRVGLLIMDIDDFKQINDRFGHDAGDALLRAFSERLTNHVRVTDTVARLGGDEFAVILPDVTGEDDVTRIATAILARMQEPLMLGSLVRECRASIGGTISVEQGMTAEELLKQADLALYNCKAAGRGIFEMFKPVMRDEAQKRASALEVARQAVVQDWIVPFYQPKVALGTGRLAGFEALLRLRHPRMGIQSPDALAPAFDDTELGIAIGNRMLSCVVSDMRQWLDAGLDIGRISINASAAEFRRDDYAERVLEYLRLAGVPASYLGVEVTESVFLGSGTDLAERTLRTLSTSGVSIALDDFGTGYASLTHLKRFPVDVIKIDRSFVSDMGVDAGDAAIIKAVLSLGQSLGIRVVAEGVETADQASFLREHGCDLGQGYYFGRPMPAREALQFMTSLAHEARASDD
jgi:diguanylate cyclase (GGDEF)-like protein/PAS domain S-box-containing protein